jgi:hypothetical protein
MPTSQVICSRYMYQTCHQEQNATHILTKFYAEYFGNIYCKIDCYLSMYFLFQNTKILVLLPRRSFQHINDPINQSKNGNLVLVSTTSLVLVAKAGTKVECIFQPHSSFAKRIVSIGPMPKLRASNIAKLVVLLLVS